MSIVEDFKLFIARGNVIDLAVGVIMGGAFGAIAKSLVDDIVMPPLGLLTGNADFVNHFVLLKDGAKIPGPYASIEAAKAGGAVILRYGAFLNTIVTFILVALAMFLVIRLVAKLYTPPPAPVMKDCPKCLMSIPEKASRCGHCTSELEASPVA